MQIQQEVNEKKKEACQNRKVTCIVSDEIVAIGDVVRYHKDSWEMYSTPVVFVEEVDGKYVGHFQSMFNI